MKNETSNIATATNPANFIRRKIGNTVYLVAISFSNTSQEHMEDKILRLVENDNVITTNSKDNISKTSLKFDDKLGILSVPQTGLLLEGGSFNDEH